MMDDADKACQALEDQGVTVGSWLPAGGAVDPTAATRQALERLLGSLERALDLTASDLSEAKARADDMRRGQ